MKYTSVEFIKTKNFKPIKIINIFRKNKHIKTLELENTALDLIELKRIYRKQQKTNKKNNKLAVIDNYNNYYNFEHLENFKNIVENYNHYQKLLEYLKKENYQKIEVQEANKTTTYFKTFKIIKI